MAWRELLGKFESFQRQLSRFRIEFLDEFDFMKLPIHFEDPDSNRIKGFEIPIFGPRLFMNIYISGFLGSHIADKLIKSVEQGSNVRIITEHKRPDIIKMHKGGVEVRQIKTFMRVYLLHL